MGHRGPHNSSTSVNFWQKGTLYTGYSINIDDCVVIPRKIVKSIVDNEFLKADLLDPDAAVEDVKNKKVMNMSRQQLSQQYINGNNNIWTAIYKW